VLQLVLGTRNRKKGLELAEFLAPLRIDVRTLEDFSDAVEIEEDGETFAANAAKKAVEQAQQLGQWVLGEDSGLVVDALGGAPGIYSARYARPNASDAENNRRLLKELGDVPLAERTAHYVCHAALADPNGAIRATAEGRCDGRIIFQPRGAAGFGYDPLFEIPQYGKTFGELGQPVKSAISHRAQALRDLIPKIERLIRSGEWKG